MLESAEFWVAMAFIAFGLLIIYFKVPGMIVKGLDARAEEIAKELDDVRRLKEEAQELLASYKRKQRKAGAEAGEMVDHANAEAERLAKASVVEVTQALERRTQAALDKVAQAESQAVKEVRHAAADITLGAARRVIKEHMDADKAAALIQDSIDQSSDKLH